MSDYIIGICEELEKLTGFDFFEIQDALERATGFDFSAGLPDPRKPADLRRLFKQLRPWLT